MNDITYLGRPLSEHAPSLAGTKYINPDADDLRVAEFRRAQQEREQQLRPLRIDSRTTILVRADKCNEAYAVAYRKQASGEQPRGEQAAAEEEHPRRRGDRRETVRREYDGGRCVRKECSWCRRVLPLDAYPRNGQSKDGTDSICKECRKERYGRKGGSHV